jgi:hypothetical protein
MMVIKDVNYMINMAPNDELDAMRACGMENGDGFILILVRIHARQRERFADLDSDNSGWHRDR